MFRERIPLSKWTEPLTWSTQFNDLRKPDTLIRDSSDDPIKVIRQELKHQALFQSQTIIRDSDLVNHLQLQQLILDNEDGLQVAIHKNVFVFAIRQDKESFTEVNENAGKRRAYPERRLQAQQPIKRLDSLIMEKNIKIVEIDLMERKDVFREKIIRISESSYLSEIEKIYLKEAIKRADEKAKGNPIRFGDIYQYLIKQKQHNLVQWCREAHILTVPAVLNIALSSANEDLLPSHVAFILGHEPDEAVDLRPWTKFFPKKILTEEALEGLNFVQIVNLREKGSEIGYFEAISLVHSKIGKHDFDKAFVNYLQTLEQYIKAIKLDADVELVNWQYELVKESVTRRDTDEEMACWGVPIFLGAMGSFFTQNLVPLTAGVAIGQLTEILRRSRRNYHPLPLKRFLNGMTISRPK